MTKRSKIVKPHGFCARISIDKDWVGKSIRATAQGPTGPLSYVGIGEKGNRLFLPKNFIGLEVDLALAVQEGVGDAKARFYRNEVQAELNNVLYDICKSKINSDNVAHLEDNTKKLQRALEETMNVDLAEDCVYLLDLAENVMKYLKK